jgi:hypothetical protein
MKPDEQEPESIEDIEVIPVYPDDASMDEQRRAFVLSHLASPEIDGKILAENCDRLARWLECGDLSPKTKLKAV